MAHKRGRTSSRVRPGVGAATQSLSSVKVSASQRVGSGIGEFDRVLGGGLVPGQVILLAGEPGIGKSTLLLQVADRVARLASKGREEVRGDRRRGRQDGGGGAGMGRDNNLLGGVLYISGEESAVQLRLRSTRLKISGEGIEVYPETDVDALLSGWDQTDYRLVIVDSVQTLTTGDLAGPAGSIGQVRETAARLTAAAKAAGRPLILVGHVTKSGAVAGPKVLEHLVDTVLYLEGDQNHQFRLLRATKNRFGSVNEVGVFEMGERGLEEVKNPSDRFLEERLSQAPGSVVTVVLEGTRPVCLEVQALAAKTVFGYPKRTASGISLNKLNLLAAVLEKRAGVRLYDQDVYINIAGGVRVSDPAADLAVALAIAGSVLKKAVKSDMVVWGEVGLSGEVRRVAQETRRLKEAQALGLKTAIGPSQVKTVKEAIKRALG